MSQSSPVNSSHQSSDNSEDNEHNTCSELEADSPLSFISGYWDQMTPSSNYRNVPEDLPRIRSILEDQLLAMSVVPKRSFSSASPPGMVCEADHECRYDSCVPSADMYGCSLAQMGSVVVVHPQYLQHHGLPTSVLLHLNSIDCKPRYVTLGVDPSVTVTNPVIPALHLLAHEVRVLEQVIGRLEYDHETGHEGDKTPPCISKAHCEQADHSPGHPHRNDTRFRQYMLKNIRASMANISESARLLAQDDALAEPTSEQKESLLGEVGYAREDKGVRSIVATACGCQQQAR